MARIVVAVAAPEEPPRVVRRRVELQPTPRADERAGANHGGERLRRPPRLPQVRRHNLLVGARTLVGALSASGRRSPPSAAPCPRSGVRVRALEHRPSPRAARARSRASTSRAARGTATHTTRRGATYPPRRPLTRRRRRRRRAGTCSAARRARAAPRAPPPARGATAARPARGSHPWGRRREAARRRRCRGTRTAPGAAARSGGGRPCRAPACAGSRRSLGNERARDARATPGCSRQCRPRIFPTCTSAPSGKMAVSSWRVARQGDPAGRPGSIRGTRLLVQGHVRVVVFRLVRVELGRARRA